MIRKLAKYLLPHGVVEVLRNRRELGKLGRPLSPSEWLCSDRLVWKADESGLSLVPPGFAKDFKYVVDVGANEGQWSSMMLDLLKPTKAMIIEPTPHVFETLRKAVGHHACVDLRNIVVGDHIGTVKFKVTRDTKGASVLAPDPAMKKHVQDNWEIAQEAELPMETLDHLLADWPEVSLLKIDVQGFEKQVLAGAEQTLKKTKFLLIELNYMRQYQGGSWFGDLHELLTQQFGFFLCNVARPLSLDHHAIMSDGLYVNPQLVPSLARP